VVDDLIFDVGFHHGQYTECYPSADFRVEAVETNPGAVTPGRRRVDRGILLGMTYMFGAE
jgi:hypothetical protein